MFERILQMGAPNTGKTYQLLKTYQALSELGVKCQIIDLEDKVEAAISGWELALPKDFSICLTWEEYKEVVDNISLPPNSWIFVDRIDLTWSMVQRWFTQQKYDEELADRMLKRSKDMKKSSMFIPRFDQGSWQVINEAYESTTLNLLYRSRCNILMTTGIRGIDENSPLDIFSHLGVAPRGQKELPHQPHTVHLLHMRKKGKELSWHITTAKDLKNREWFDGEQLFDLNMQYISEYWSPGR